MNEFKKSSKCDAGACVRVKFDETSGMVIVRDDFDSESWFTHFEWIEFVEAVKRGEFDYPN